jgi:hypothetical protein
MNITTDDATMVLASNGVVKTITSLKRARWGYSTKAGDHYFVEWADQGYLLHHVTKACSYLGDAETISTWTGDEAPDIVEATASDASRYLVGIYYDLDVPGSILDAVCTTELV